MNIESILKDLRDELLLFNQAIETFERLAAGQGKRRGRPPAWMKRLDAATAGDSQMKRRRGPTPQKPAEIG